MKAESNIMPVQPYTIDRSGDKAIVTFFCDVKKIEKDGGEAAWEYQTHELVVTDRPDLGEMIDDGYQQWLDAAVQASDQPCPPCLDERIDALEMAVLEMALGGY